MARLPDASALPTPDVRARRGLATIDATAIGEGYQKLGRGVASGGEAAGAGIQALGKGITSIGVAVAQYGEKQDALTRAKAEAAALISFSNVDEARDNERDPANLGDDFKKHYNDSVDTAAASISNPYDREMFKARWAPAVADRHTKVNGRVFDLQNQESEGDSVATLRQLSEAGVKATDDAERQKYVKAGHEVFNKREELGFITPAEAEKGRQLWSNGFAYEVMKRLPAQQKMAAIARADIKGNETVKTAYDFFVGRGWSKQAAAGIVGGLFTESGLNPNARNPGDASDGTDSVGAAQWNMERLAALKAFGGKNWQDLNVQLAFVDRELKGPESAAGEALRSAKDVNAAAEAFLRYERPRNYQYGIGGAMGGQKRLASANAVFQEHAGGTAANGSEMVALLTNDQVDHLRNQAQSQQAGDRAELTTLLKDDQASIMSTGQPLQEINPTRVASVMGPAAGEAFVQNRAMAMKYYSQTNDWDQMPADVIQERLVKLEPQQEMAGQPGFALQQAYYDAAVKKATAVITERTNDPAAAADRLPQVKAARGQGDLAVVKARIAAQEAMGVSEYARAPITAAEAKGYAAKLRPLARGQADVAHQEEVASGLVEEIGRRYGEYAPRVLQQVMGEVTMKRDAAEVLAAAVQKLVGSPDQRQGPVFTPDQTKKIEIENKADLADRMRGFDPYNMPSDAELAAQEAKRPYTEALKALRANPKDLLPFFIKKYGRERVPSDLTTLIDN